MRIIIIIALGVTCYYFSKMNMQSPAKTKYVATINDSIAPKNKKIIAYTAAQGPRIAPTYNAAVCTELVIGVLQHFTTLTRQDKKRIRIITNESINDLLKQNSDVPKGVYYALISSGKGKPVNSLSKVMPGDFVQFWEPGWGHCGIVHSINIQDNTMQLYSSNPSTNGYGIQTFNIPVNCWFVRLS